MTRPLRLAFTLTLLLAGCANTVPAPTPDASDAADAATRYKVLGSMALPSGAEILQDKETLILGDGSSWVGRVTLKIDQPPLQAASAFLESFGRSGWALQSSLTSETSILVFSKGERTATLEISAEGNWVGKTSKVRITISPRPAAMRFDPPPPAPGH